MSTNDQVVRLDAKFASIARTGKTALVCFYVRGQEDDLADLIAARDADLMLGVVITSEVATDGQVTE